MYGPNMKLHGFTPTKIIYNGVATVVFWDDGTKTVVKKAEGTTYDRYNAFCAALAKKMYGNNSTLKKYIKDAENAKKSTNNNTPIKVGDRVRVLDGSTIPNYAGGWVGGMRSQVGKIFTVSGILDRWGDDRRAAVSDAQEWVYDLRGLEKV